MVGSATPIHLCFYAKCSNTPGLQVIIFGEAGAGKTSLANISTNQVKPIYIFCPKDSSFISIMADIVYKLVDSLDRRADFTFDLSTGNISKGSLKINIDSINVNIFASLIPRDRLICIVLDEVDRVEDESVVGKLAELAKGISTVLPQLTLIFVGVGDDAESLLKGHSSNFRNLRQVPLGRMERKDLEAILDRGENILDIKFSDVVKKAILNISDNFPYWVHLLATSSAEICLIRSVKTVNQVEFRLTLSKAAKEAEASLKEDYNLASRSTHGSTIYRRILSALANNDDVSLSLSTVQQDINEKGDKVVTKQSVGQALIVLTKPERRKIVVREGDGFYKFRNPLMKGYIKVSESLNNDA
ncbi:ATP-binding protein [Deinococcus radiomollis]|uniref:hypothetical protein n=1 Tax=Deinococcus radiomollis TaxID=468916 RepID=UPI003891C752